MITHDILSYACYIVLYALNHNLKINNSQLNRFMYLFGAEWYRQHETSITNHYALYNKTPKFNDYGPVYPTVYHTFETFGSRDIKSTLLDDGPFDFNTFQFMPVHYDETEIDPDFKQIVQQYIRPLLNINIFDIIEYLKNLHNNLSFGQYGLGSYTLDELIEKKFKMEMK